MYVAIFQQLSFHNSLVCWHLLGHYSDNIVQGYQSGSDVVKLRQADGRAAILP